MNFFIGFLIALAVGFDGIGGGSFTVPRSFLIVGLTAGDSGRHSLCLRGSPAADRRAVLSRGEKLSCALSVAPSAWSNSRP